MSRKVSNARVFNDGHCNVVGAVFEDGTGNEHIIYRDQMNALRWIDQEWLDEVEDEEDLWDCILNAEINARF